MQSVLTAKSLNIETIVISNPKINKTNKQLTAAILNETTKSALYIETPYLINPFGVTSYDGGKTISEEQRSYSLSIKAQGRQNESVDEINVLFDTLKKLDEKAIDYCQTHSQTIFKKKYESHQRDILADLLFNRGVKPSIGKDGTVYPDKISLKIMKNDKLQPEILVFKDSDKPLEISSFDELIANIPSGLAIKVILQPKIYFVNGKAGINYRVLQVKLPNFEKVGRPTGYAFSEPPSTNSDDLLKQTENLKISNSDDLLKQTDDLKKKKEEEEAEDSEVEVDDA